MKGGYKIIDFNNTPLSSTAVAIAGLVEAISLINGKAVLLTNVVIGDEKMDDCFTTFIDNGDGTGKFNCYDGYISVNDDGEATYTVASASGMAGDIAELQGDLADTNNMIAPPWSATATYTKNAIVRDGGHLYKAKSDVPTGTVTSNTTYWENTNEGDLIKSTKIKYVDMSLTPQNPGTWYTLSFDLTNKIVTHIDILNASNDTGYFTVFRCAQQTNNVYVLRLNTSSNNVIAINNAEPTDFRLWYFEL